MIMNHWSAVAVLQYFIEFVILDSQVQTVSMLFHYTWKTDFLDELSVRNPWNWALTKLQMSRMRHENKVLQHELECLDFNESRQGCGTVTCNQCFQSNDCMVRASSLATKWLACAIKKSTLHQNKKNHLVNPGHNSVSIVKSRVEIGFLVMAAPRSKAYEGWHQAWLSS